MLNTQAREEKQEQPLLNVKVEVDSWRHGHFERLNWSLMNNLDLVEIFQTILPEEKGKYKNDRVPYEIAKRRAKRFKARLQAYVLEKTDGHGEPENFDWSEWFD